MISNKLFVAVLCLTFISQSYEYYTTGECIKSPIIKDFSAEKVKFTIRNLKISVMLSLILI